MMVTKVSVFLAMVAVCGLVASPTWSAEWGNLSGQIIFDGPIPVPAKAKITSDKEVCCQYDVIDESLLVNPETKGVKNVVVMLTQSRRDERDVPVHESYGALKDEPVRMDNSACRFDPHITLIWTARKVVISNSDPIGHNVNLSSHNSEAFNETIPSGGTIEKTLTEATKMPVIISCSIHPWMKGFAIVRDNPYMTVTDDDGAFEIKNLPSGKWQFMFWQEAAGYLSEIKRNGQAEKWRRGTVEIDIQPGDNDLGQIVVDPDLFEK
jgi:hypothetical protein